RQLHTSRVPHSGRPYHGTVMSYALGKPADEHAAHCGEDSA
ncbi:MAG: hypothetical protein QOJ78_856, partial [Pseudonocardiales bacterium]|nr:hypothetical protein [Pseudonocardiales bacterium]